MTHDYTADASSKINGHFSLTVSILQTKMVPNSRENERKMGCLTGGFRYVTHSQLERTRRDFAKAAISIKRNGDAYGGVMASKAKSAFNQTIVDLVYMEG